MALESVNKAETTHHNIMKRTTLLLILAVLGMAQAAGQNEYRITQALPADIDSIYVPAGWTVRLSQAPQASLTIVTPCEAFFAVGSEPQVCTVERRKLTLTPTRDLPRSTVVEIALAAPIKQLYVADSATLTTGKLNFAMLGVADIRGGAVVSGTTWHGYDRLLVYVRPDARLTLDTLSAFSKVMLECPYDATVVCPTVLSNESLIRKDKNSLGTFYVSDSTHHLTVKHRNRRWLRKWETLEMSVLFSAPIPLYMNNKSGSAYNRGESYGIAIQFGTNYLSLTDRLKWHTGIKVGCDWSRLLNQVTTDGTRLELAFTPSAETPQQHLNAFRWGLYLEMTYGIGHRKPAEKWHPLNLNFGLAATINKSSLVTRTMGSGNRWHKERETANVYNPFQLQAHVGISELVFTRFSIKLTYDLLPTFRSGIGADKIHTFGITFGF